MTITQVWSVFSVAPSKQRELLLQGLLDACCFPELSYVSAQLRELIKVDYISTLPPELSYKILGYLDTTSLCRAAQVNKRWKEMAEDDVVWREMCEQHIAKKCKKCGWGLPTLDHKRLQHEKKTIAKRAMGQLAPTPAESRAVSEAPSEIPVSSAAEDGEPSAKRPRLEEVDPSTKRPWKEVYMYRFKVGRNWKHGRHNLKTLEGHANGVMCLQFVNNTLATGSYDGTIKIWDLETGTEKRTLRGHTSGIRCLQLSNCQVISGGMDRTIRIWNWVTGDLIKTVEGPTGDVLSVFFKYPYLVSGGKDNLVRIWNFQTHRQAVLSGHQDYVNSVRVDLPSRTVFSAGDDHIVKLWDLDTNALLHTFTGHVGGVQQIALAPPTFELDAADLVDCEHSSSDSEPEPETSSDELPRPIPESLPNPRLFPQDPDRPNPPKYMFTASLDSTIRLWHVPTGRMLRTFFGHIEGIWSIAADNLRLVSGAEDRTVKIWDPRTGKCERTFTGHNGPVTCVGLSGDKLISGGEDGAVRVMDFAPDEV